MLRRMGIIPSDHRFNPRQPDWNCRGHESIPRELDNGQTRALADAPWDLPFGQCSEDHLRLAQANLDRHFAFVGLTENFNLSLLLLKRICGWRWRFYVPKNITPANLDYHLPPEVLGAVAELNRFDRQLHAFAAERFAAQVLHYGLALHLEHGAYVACNAVHQGIHHVRQPLKKIWKQWRTPEPKAVDLKTVSD
jgi:hypothetical protein